MIRRSPRSTTCPYATLFRFFFFNDTATTEIYPLSLPDPLPICPPRDGHPQPRPQLVIDPLLAGHPRPQRLGRGGDRKSTRLNSSHSQISYAVFCLKKKKKANIDRLYR